jgi:hypothetical protein
MSRSGYSDDCENLELYRAAVDRAIRGARGQHFLRKLRAALDAMPVKRLITGEIVNTAGEVCALGAVDSHATVDPDDRYAVAHHFGIAQSMAAEIAYVNDEYPPFRSTETPEERWTRMRQWVEQQIVPHQTDVAEEARPTAADPR